MSSFEDFFAEKHRSLKQDFSDDCLKIAKEIATKFLEEGKAPYITIMMRLEQMGEEKYYGPIIPLAYGGRIAWTKHYICCCDGEVYDAIIGRPIKIEEYSQVAFGMEIPMETFIPTSELRSDLKLSLTLE